MLIEFSVTNFRSIKETQTLSLAASNATELRESNCFTVPERGVPDMLRSAAIYGPNASGKSNFMLAIEFVESFVRESSQKGQEGDSIKAEPFLFSTVSRSEPSEFEVLFLQEGVRYQYGFAVNQTRVIHEWLIAYPDGRPQRWFEREFDKTASKDIWYFGSKLKGRKSVLQESTRSNALFLSTAVQLNNEQLKPAYNWFRQKLRIIDVNGITPAFTADECGTEAGRKKVLEFLNAADLSITDIKVELKKFNSAVLPDDMPAPLKDVILKGLDGKEVHDIKFLHTVAGTNELVAIDSRDESAGTRKLFTFAGPWLDVLKNGYILFVDELNNSMHPLMVHFLIGLINNPRVNKNNAQLVFSTHDTSVLDNNLFRRDQIWFTEKDDTNATRLYPLTDFTPRKGEALGKGYLNGRYGALPYVGELSS